MKYALKYWQFYLKVVKIMRMSQIMKSESEFKLMISDCILHAMDKNTFIKALHLEN